MSTAYKDLFASITSALEAVWHKLDDKKGSDLEMDLEVDFWCDPQTVLFETSAGDDEIYAATLDDIDDTDEQLSSLITKDIVDTYLRSQDFAVIFGIDEDDENILVAAVDRSTGVALVKPDNILDSTTLEQTRAIAESNKDSNEPVPIVLKYQLVLPRDREVEKRKKDNATRRLTALLTDIEVAALESSLGCSIEIREDL